MKHLFTPLLLLGLVFCGLTGCSSTTEIISAGLRIELTQIRRDSSGVHVTWRVHNPNVVSYLFSKSTHKLTLDGTVVGTLEDASPVGLPQFNRVERTATLVPANAATAQVVDRALAQGSASYRLDSTVWVLIVDDQIEKIPLSASGSVPVSAK